MDPKPIEKDVALFEERHPVAVESSNPETAIMAAIQKGYEPAFIEKMMELQERWEANNARKAFFDDLANFKAEAPPVKKDKYNKFFDSWYTSLGNLLDTYNPVLGKHGLSVSFPIQPQTGQTMTVECRLSHRMGHSESISLTAPIDQAAVGKSSGQRSRTPIQDVKSTFTYLRSATCEAVLGVAGTEATQNDDGNGAGGVAYITDEEQADLEALMSEVKADGPKFLKYFEIVDLSELPANKYKAAVKALEAKRA